MKARFSIWSQFYNTKEPEEAILEFEKDGLEYTELSSEHITSLLEREGSPEKIGTDFANFCWQHGIKIPQAHMVFPSNIVSDSGAIDLIEKQIKMLSAMGVRAAVLHGDHLDGTALSYEEKIEKNIEAFRTLAERVGECSLTVCIENLQRIFVSIDEILYVLDRVGSDLFGICLDTGHLNLTATSSQREFILKAGSRLKALHIADNDRSRDQHIAPFGIGTVDFAEVVDALREIGYDGLFNYEIGGEAHKCPVPVKHRKILGIKAGYDYLMSSLSE